MRRDWVERPELVQRLAAATAKLILVDASAGFGKTTLVAQWQASTMESRPFAWLSLDDGENDPSRLWWHIIHALQKACPGLVGEENHRQLRADDPDITGTVLPVLLNELTGLTAPVILVLDDYQAVTDPSCHEQMAFFLLHLPASDSGRADHPDQSAVASSPGGGRPAKWSSSEPGSCASRPPRRLCSSR